jgi:hypothetical protein
VKHVATITPAASRKVTPTGDVRWRVSWKDGVVRNIRIIPLDDATDQNWPHTGYKTETADQTVQSQARPVLPDEVDRKLSRERREVPWACANRQHQDLELMTVEPCRCNPEQVQCCEEQLVTLAHQEKMVWHDYQVAWMQAAMGYLLKDNPAWLQPYGNGSGTFSCLPPLKRLIIGDAGKWFQLGPGRFGWAVSRGVRLQYEKWRERRFRTPHTWLLSESDIGAAFVAMLYVADDLDAAFSRQHQRTISVYCDAPTLSARCYQAAASVLTAYYGYGLLGVAEHDIFAARIVTEIFDSHLRPRHVKQRSKVVDDYFIVTRMLDKSEDLSVSAYKVAEHHGLEASTVRKRFDRKLKDIESQLSKYCRDYNALAYYPQTASRIGYNIISRAEPPAPRLAQPALRDTPQAFSNESKTELAAMQVLVWAQGHCRKQVGLLPQRLPPGTACHYVGTGEIGRHYPTQPYGAEPLIILLPQPAHDFKHEVSTELPPALGFPFDNNFQRWSALWLTAGIKHKDVPERFPIELRGPWRGREDVSAPRDDDAGDDLVKTLKAHSEREDRISSSKHDFRGGYDEDDEAFPLFEQT